MTPETDLETPPMDPVFRAALHDRPTEWAIRAVAGYTMREFCTGDPEALELANRHGLSRAHTPDERAAWTFGFTWLDRLS